MASQYLTIEEVAEIERINLFTAYRHANLGRIPGAKKIGNQWRINRGVYEKARGFAPPEPIGVDSVASRLDRIERDVAEILRLLRDR